MQIICQVCGHAAEAKASSTELSFAESCEACGASLYKNDKLMIAGLGEGGAAPAPAPSPSPGTPPPAPKPVPEPAGPPGSPPDAHDPTFVRELSSVMRDNMYKRVIPKRKRGKLDDKRLWRAHTGQINLFKQKHEKKNKNYRVTLLLDISSSMSGQKINIARDALYAIGLNLEKAGISVQVRAFNLDYYKIKETSTPMPQADLGWGEESLVQRHYAKNGLPIAGTHILLALSRAYAELEASRTAHQQEILLVFSDGDPSSEGEDHLTELWDRNSISQETKDFFHGDRKAYMRMAQVNDHCDFSVFKQLIAQNREVTTLGVGIAHTAVEDFCPRSVVVNDLATFKRDVINLLRTTITR